MHNTLKDYKDLIYRTNAHDRCIFAFACISLHSYVYVLLFSFFYVVQLHLCLFMNF